MFLFQRQGQESKPTYVSVSLSTRKTGSWRWGVWKLGKVTRPVCTSLWCGVQQRYFLKLQCPYFCKGTKYYSRAAPVSPMATCSPWAAICKSHRSRLSSYAYNLDSGVFAWWYLIPFSVFSERSFPCSCHGTVLQAAGRLLDSFRPQLSTVVLGVLVRLFSVLVRRFAGSVVPFIYIINVTNTFSLWISKPGTRCHHFRPSLCSHLLTQSKVSYKHFICLQNVYRGIIWSSGYSPMNIVSSVIGGWAVRVAYT
jgi:hypothetical protein